MRVLYVTPEAYPLVKTGGLGDVSAALPRALLSAGMDVRMLMPGYPSVLDGLGAADEAGWIAEPPGAQRAELLLGRGPDGVQLYALDAPALYVRTGGPYVSPAGADWPDNAVRFAALGWAAAALFDGIGRDGWRPDLLHCHDWQAGLAPAYLRLRGGRRPASVMTIHNIRYQGIFPAGLLHAIRLPPESFVLDGVEFYGNVSYLKAGIAYADKISTVSPTYAQEIQRPPEGCGLEGLLAHRRADLVGILNGVDYETWTPETDRWIAAPYGLETLERKALNKRALVEAFGLACEDGQPLFGCVSRLAGEKGMDLLLDALPRLLEAGGRLVLLGAGDKGLEQRFRAAAAEHAKHVGVRIGYDEALAHRIQAGTDVFLVPSRSEPCGLTQLYALRYGTLPLVRRIGGLADTVTDAAPEAIRAGTATGFAFDEASAAALAQAMLRACDLHRDREAWRTIQRAGMRRRFSWAQAAEAYRALYQSALRSAQRNALSAAGSAA